MAELTRKQRWTEAIVTGLIVTAISAGLAALSAISSSWFHPIFYGLIGGALVLVACMSVLLLKRIPRVQVIPTTKNIESCVKTWLDNYKVSVRVEPGKDFFFRFKITLDNDLALDVVRCRDDYPDYIQIICDLGVRGDAILLLNRFSVTEKTDILFNIKMELARVGMAYGGLVDPPENFHIFRRIPIQHNLTEYIFMSMVGQVEAARNMVILIFLKARLDMERRENLNSTRPQ